MDVFINILIKIVISIICGIIVFFLTKSLAKSVVQGKRLLFLGLLIILISSAGVLYTLTKSSSNVLDLNLIEAEYNQKIEEYKKINITEWTDRRNNSVKNLLLYEMRTLDNAKECVPNKLMEKFTGSLKEVVSQNVGFVESDMMKKTIEICEVSHKILEINNQESCATKENGLLCSTLNPLVHLLKKNTFDFYSFDIPEEIKTKEESPLDKTEDELVESERKTIEKITHKQGDEVTVTVDMENLKQELIKSKSPENKNTELLNGNEKTE